MTPRSDYQLEMRISPDEIIVDSFAGGGGASLGIQWALGRSPHKAINHDKEAMALHEANLSPDCKHFSKAKGGKPVSKKIRGLAWTACRWAKAVRPRVIVLENVEEFEQWGPLIKVDGKWKPDPARMGHTFNRFVARLRRLGYVVEWRLLRASHYATPTIRRRFFLIARCDGRPIVWPIPTHGKGLRAPLTAATIIDWSIPCPSIFTRKKALAENTQRRIARGIQRYVVDSPKPFIVQYHSAKRAGDDRIAAIDAPLGTQTVENRFAVVSPIVVGSGGPAYQGEARPLDLPHRTILSESNAALITPIIGRAAHGEEDRNGKRRGQGAHDITEPLGTVLASNEFSLIAPVIAGVGGRAGQSPERRLDQPYQTITSKADASLVSGLLVPTTHEGDARAHSLKEPTRTITGAHRGEIALAASFLKPRFGEDPDPSRRGGLGQAPRVRSLEVPAPTIVPTGNGGDLVSAFLAKHQSERHDGEVQASAIDDPMPTVKTRDSTAVVAAHVAKHYGGRVGSSLEEPLHTVTAESVHHAVVASSLINMRGTDDSQIGGRSIEEPLPTISGGGIHAAEVRAFLISYYGTPQASGDLNDPSPTVTAKDRLGLVTISGVEYQIVDIGMRMLQPRELYRAQGFPDSYKIAIPFDYVTTSKKTGKTRTVRKPLTKTAQVRMAGNSVCPPLAAAIVSANLLGETFAMNGGELVA